MANMMFLRLEIHSSEINTINKKQLAYLTDKGFFVYRNGEGEYKYFKDSPEFSQAINDGTINTINRERRAKMFGNNING